jgi:hypothetical protein
MSSMARRSYRVDDQRTKEPVTCFRVNSSPLPRKAELTERADTSCDSWPNSRNNGCERIQQEGGGRLYNQLSEVRFVVNPTSGRTKTAERGGSKREKLAVGAFH